MAHLDQLPPGKEIAQLGAVLGREFPYEVLPAVAPRGTPRSQRLAQLVAGLLYQRGRRPQAGISLSMRSSRTWRIVVVDGAPGSSTISALPRRWRPGSRRPSRRSPNWSPSTIPTRAAPSRRWSTGSGRVNRPATAQPMWKPSATAPTGIALLQTLPETPERTQQALTLYIALGAALQMPKGRSA